MNDDELSDALDGLFAYDEGATDSGIHDELLRQRVKAEIWQDLRPGQLFSDRVARIARELFLTDAQIGKGYGLEDLRSFINWLDDEIRL